MAHGPDQVCRASQSDLLVVWQDIGCWGDGHWSVSCCRIWSTWTQMDIVIGGGGGEWGLCRNNHCFLFYHLTLDPDCHPFSTPMLPPTPLPEHLPALPPTLLPIPWPKLLSTPLQVQLSPSTHMLPCASPPMLPLSAQPMSLPALGPTTAVAGSIDLVWKKSCGPYLTWGLEGVWHPWATGLGNNRFIKLSVCLETDQL